MAIERPVVVDANVLFGALLRDGLVRHLVLFAGMDLRTPPVFWEELQRNQAMLLDRTHASEASFALLLDAVRRKVVEVPVEAIQPCLDDALARLGPRERLDAPYVAAAEAVQAILWTQDKRLARKAGVPVLDTAGILAALAREP